MGKRELLLAAVVVVVGFVVYQFTAPPGDPSKPGFSFSRILNEIRREVRGQREFAEGTKTSTIAVPLSVREIRLDELISTQVTVIGEERSDIATEFHVRSNGYDQAEAKRLVEATRLSSDAAGALLIIATRYPVDGRQTGRLTLRIPSRLGFRTDGKSGVMKISNVESIAIGTARGDTELSNITGHVAVTQRGSQITIQNVGSLKLQAVSAEAKISNVRGDTTLNLQGGEFTASELSGALEVESRNAEMVFERLEKLRGPVRVNATGGELTLQGLAIEARVDGRETQMRIQPASPSALGIYNNDDDIELTLPDGGMRLDVMATEGDITLDEALQKTSLTISPPPEEPQQDGPRTERRVTGEIRGGGPTLTVRARRGDVVLKSK